MTVRVGWFLLRHHRLMGIVGAIFHRTTGPWRYRAAIDFPHCLFCRAIAAATVSIPGYLDDIAKGRKDLDAGRSYVAGNHRGMAWRNGLNTPSKTWRADDPIQPAGWCHDGTRWRLKRDGGWVKGDGYWRYNKPGDPGWTRNPDGSWRYVEAEA